MEICIGGVWGTVANNGWDTRAAQVVCEQLFGRNVLGNDVYYVCAYI